MPRKFYYTLIASLPALPRFDRAQRLPITREQLERRLSMLETDEAEALIKLESYLFWREQAKKESDQELVSQYKYLLQTKMPEELREFSLFWMTERTVLVALRRKQRGFSAPTRGELWGVGKWVKHIESNWDDPYFRLTPVYPWIVKIKGLLETGESLELERWILNYAWDKLDSFAVGKEWELIAVAVYVLKWNILQHWLSFNPDAARVRFEELISEVCDEHRENYRSERESCGYGSR